VVFLADDLLEGREAATRGHDLAARYVASVLQAIGVEPGGPSGSYFQDVPLRESRVTGGALMLAPPAGASAPLDVPGDGVVLADHFRPVSDVTAPVVYAGFGVTAPELGYDDYAGIDPRGKIVLALYGAPAHFPSEPRAHYATAEQKLRNAARRGAVGLVITFLPDDERRYPWEQWRETAAGAQMTWRNAENVPANYPAEIRGRAYLSGRGKAKLFAQSPTMLDEIHAAAEKGRPRAFDLPLSLTIRTTTSHRDVASPNVVGMLKGREPGLAASYVVLTSHLDHVGIGKAIGGDTVYNGAYDNAAGCAVLLEVARALADPASRPRRSVIVAFVTAEEKGLVGSDYFAANPGVPRRSMVANVNVDMPVLQWPFTEILAFGAENSSLGERVAAAVKPLGLRVAPDPMPQENLFVRSDQYSFVKHGIPAVFIMPGHGSSDPARNGSELFSRFFSQHYHRPSDDSSLSLDLGAAARFVDATRRIVLAVADQAGAPSWHPANFFGETYGRRSP
jgi:hypothetical protein